MGNKPHYINVIVQKCNLVIIIHKITINKTMLGIKPRYLINVIVSKPNRGIFIHKITINETMLGNHVGNNSVEYSINIIYITQHGNIKTCLSH